MVKRNMYILDKALEIIGVKTRSRFPYIDKLDGGELYYDRQSENFTGVDNGIYQICKKALDVVKNPDLYNKEYIGSLISDMSEMVDLGEPAYLAILVYLLVVMHHKI